MSKLFIKRARLELFESRVLFNALLFSGAEGSDTFYVARDPTLPSTIDVWNNAASGTKPETSPDEALSVPGNTELNFSGTGSDAALTVDLSNGIPNLQGIGWNSPGKLTVTGGASSSIAIGVGSVTYGSLPITFGNGSTVTLDTPDMSQTVVQSAAPDVPINLDAGGAISLTVDSGSLTVGSDSMATGPLTFSSLSIASGAEVHLSSPSSSGDVAADVAIVSNLSINNGGTLDVGFDDLDVKNSNLQVISTLVGSAFAGGKWNGAGITSSRVVADPTYDSALAVALNQNVNGAPLYGSGTTAGAFDGVLPGSNDVLVKCTAYGDANLDSVVDGSDYTLIDNGFNNKLTGWLNGDFNYDGVVDGSDYTLIDNSFNTQRFQISSPAELPGLVGWYGAASVETDSSGNVTEWKDLSGNGNNLFPVSGYLQPVLNPTGKAVDFTSTTGPAPLLATSGNLPFNPQSLSVFMAGNNENMGSDYQTGASTAVSVPSAVQLQYFTANGCWDISDNPTYDNAASTAIAGDQEMVVGGVSNGSQGTTLYSDGSSTVDSQVAPGNMVYAPFQLGDSYHHFFGSISELALYDLPLSPVQAGELTNYLAKNNGVNLSPTVNTVIDGDSISYGVQDSQGINHNWADDTPILEQNEYHNFARPGRQIASINPTTGYSVGGVLNSFAAFDASVANNVYFIFGGTNDIFTNTSDAEQTFDQLKAMALGAKAYGAAHGFKVTVVVATCLHRGNSDQAWLNPVADQYNAMILGDTSGAFDAVANLTDVPQLENPNDTTYFESDAIHPNPAGMEVIAGVANAAIETALGISG